MYTNLYVYKSPRLFMSGKLYWRIKKNGKWTFRAAKMGSRMINPLLHLTTEWGYFVLEEEE